MCVAFMKMSNSSVRGSLVCLAVLGIIPPPLYTIYQVGLMSLSNYRWPHSFHVLQFIIHADHSSSVSPLRIYSERARYHRLVASLLSGVE